MSMQLGTLVPSSTRSAPLSSTRHVQRLELKQLFGVLDYDITVSRDTNDDDLLILYGDNGSGKTTILRMLFNLLSKQPGQGKKTFLAKTPFSLFRITLRTGIVVAARRKKGSIVGDYTVTIEGAFSNALEFVLQVDETGNLINSQSTEELHASLAALDVSLYFLPDDRRVKADLAEDAVDNYRLQRYLVSSGSQDSDALLRREVQYRFKTGMGGTAPQSDSHHLEIGPVITALAASLRSQTIRGANEGEQNASSIYLRVIDRLISTQHLVAEEEKVPDLDLAQRIRDLDKNVNQLSSFGLLATFPAADFLHALQVAPPHDQATVRRVLEPYLEGLEARVDALRELYEVLRTYSGALNAFLSRKRVRVHIVNGIAIESLDGNSIDPALLSSGERQLFLLLSNTLLARGRSSIFIIDEPELSLNVKWQRDLVDALLRCSRGGGIQYILASHSLELITQYKSKTCRLVHKEGR